MGIMYLEGSAVTKDYRKAVQWFRLAADRGNAEAQGFLGGIFHDGAMASPKTARRRRSGTGWPLTKEMQTRRWTLVSCTMTVMA
jgi:TPR repeat protein